jgi:hypothetical protein
MELFFMMTAMLALLGPIAVGRVRCIRITPRLLERVACIGPTVSRTKRAALGGCNTWSDAGAFSAQLCWATLQTYAKPALRRLRCDLRWNPDMRSWKKASVGW